MREGVEPEIYSLLWFPERQSKIRIFPNHPQAQQPFFLSRSLHRAQLVCFLVLTKSLEPRAGLLGAKDKAETRAARHEK